MREELRKLKPFDEVTVFESVPNHPGPAHVIAEVLEVEFQSITVRVIRSMGRNDRKKGTVMQIQGQALDLVVCEASVGYRPLVEEGHTSPTLFLYVGSPETGTDRFIRIRKLPDDETVKVIFLKGRALQQASLQALFMDFEFRTKFHLNMDWAMRYGWSDQ